MATHENIRITDKTTSEAGTDGNGGFEMVIDLDTGIPARKGASGAAGLGGGGSGVVTNKAFAVSASGTYTKGSVLRITDLLSPGVSIVSQARANTSAGANAFGVAATDISNSSPSDVTTWGPATVLLASGLSVTNGDQLYVSAASTGVATNVAPVTVGQFVTKIGVVTDASAYDGVSNFTVQAYVEPGKPVAITAAVASDQLIWSTPPATFSGKGTLPQYSLVYVGGTDGSGNLSVAQTDASSAGTAVPIGITQTAVTGAATTTLLIEGRTKALAKSGLTPTIGDPIWVSETQSGVVTNVAPTGSGNYTVPCGYITGTSTYGGSGTLDVVFLPARTATVIP